MNAPHYAQENGLPWATVDLHCHTTLSDGRKTARELVDAALAKGAQSAGHVELLAVTDHDAVNDEAVALLRGAGVDTCEAVEISACDYEGGRHSLHLTYYARSVGRQVRDLLAGIRGARVGKIAKQCALLASNGFSISFTDMEAEAARRGMAADCLNNLDLARVVLARPQNVARARAVLGGAADGMVAQAEEMDASGFIDCFLKRDSRMPEVGCARVADYEPSVEECGRLAREEGGLLAVAHPNFTYQKKGVAKFLEKMDRFARLGVRGVELNPMADVKNPPEGKIPQGWPEEAPISAARPWESAVRWAAKRNGLFVTYGSDWHGDEDARHAGLGELHKSWYEGGGHREPRCALHHVNAYRREFLKLIGN